MCAVGGAAGGWWRRWGLADHISSGRPRRPLFRRRRRRGGVRVLAVAALGVNCVRAASAGRGLFMSCGDASLMGTLLIGFLPNDRPQ